MNQRKKSLSMAIVLFVSLAAVITVGIVLYSNSDSVQVKEQIDLGNKYMEDGDYEQAQAAFERAIEIEPENEEAVCGLADVYIALEQFPTAVVVLEQSPVISNSAILQNKLSTIQKNYFKQCIAQIDEDASYIQSMNEAESGFYCDLATYYVDKGNYANAIKILEQGLAITGSGEINIQLENIKKEAGNELLAKVKDLTEKSLIGGKKWWEWTAEGLTGAYDLRETYGNITVVAPNLFHPYNDNFQVRLGYPHGIEDGCREFSISYSLADVSDNTRFSCCYTNIWLKFSEDDEMFEGYKQTSMCSMYKIGYREYATDIEGFNDFLFKLDEEDIIGSVKEYFGIHGYDIGDGATVTLYTDEGNIQISERKQVDGEFIDIEHVKNDKTREIFDVSWYYDGNVFVTHRILTPEN